MNLSIIIPCKDQSNIVEMLRETELCVPGAQIIVSSDRYGNGKGWALRRGTAIANGSIICFIDGDMDIHPAHINTMLTQMSHYDICVGRKQLNGMPSRVLITICCRLFTGLLFGLWIDTQTGIKMFRRDSLPDWEDQSFAYDIEILAKAKRNKRSIKEIPVSVKISKHMPIRSIMRFIKGALKIRWMLWN